MLSLNEVQDLQEEKLERIEDNCNDVIYSAEKYILKYSDLYEEHEKVKKELREAKDTIWKLRMELNGGEPPIYNESRSKQDEIGEDDMQPIGKDSSSKQENDGEQNLLELLDNNLNEEEGEN